MLQSLGETLQSHVPKNKLYIHMPSIPTLDSTIQSHICPSHKAQPTTCLLTTVDMHLHHTACKQCHVGHDLPTEPCAAPPPTCQVWSYIESSAYAPYDPSLSNLSISIWVTSLQKSYTQTIYTTTASARKTCDHQPTILYNLKNTPGVQ